MHAYMICQHLGLDYYLIFVLLLETPLGVQLLNQRHLHLLDEIQANHQKDVRACCTEMFDTWLQTRLDACWNQLCDALTEISPPVAADNIQKQFCAGSNVCTCISRWLNLFALIHFLYM